MPQPVFPFPFAPVCRTVIVFCHPNAPNRIVWACFHQCRPPCSEQFIEQLPVLCKFVFIVYYPAAIDSPQSVVESFYLPAQFLRIESYAQCPEIAFVPLGERGGIFPKKCPYSGCIYNYAVCCSWYARISTSNMIRKCSYNSLLISAARQAGRRCLSPGKVPPIRGKMVHFPRKSERKTAAKPMFSGKVCQKRKKTIHFPDNLLLLLRFLIL